MNKFEINIHEEIAMDTPEASETVVNDLILRCVNLRGPIKHVDALTEITLLLPPRTWDTLRLTIDQKRGPGSPLPHCYSLLDRIQRTCPYVTVIRKVAGRNYP